MADIARKVRETAERLKHALENLADDLNSALGRDAEPVLVPVPARGRGRVYAGVLVERRR